MHTHKKSKNRYTQLLLNITDTLQNLNDIYQGLPAVFEKEKKFIIEHRIDDLEEVAQKKALYAENISQFFTDLKNRYRELALIHPTPGDYIHDFESHTLSSYRKMAQDITVHFSWQDLSPLLDKLDEKTEILLNTISNITPQFFENKMIVQKLLNSHQKSFHFFREIALACAASYDATGRKKTEAHLTNLKVEA